MSAPVMSGIGPAVGSPLAMPTESAGGGYGPELVTSQPTASEWKSVGSNTVTDISGGGVEITVVDDSRGALLYFFTGSPGLQIDLVEGKRYRLEIDALMTAGWESNDRIQWWDSGEFQNLQSSWTTHVFEFTASGTAGNHYIRFSIDGGDVVQAKNVSLREIL